MTYGLKNNNIYSPKDFLSSVQSIAEDVPAEDVRKGNLKGMVQKLHTDLFQGGSFAPKSMNQLLSISTPCSQAEVQLKKKFKNCRYEGRQIDSNACETVQINRNYSLYGVISLLEGIPVIGSVIAVLSCLGHLIGLSVAMDELNLAVHIYDQNKDDVDAALAVYERAVDLAKHDYYFEGSVLAITPFLKPILRLAQASDAADSNANSPRSSQARKFGALTF